VATVERRVDGGCRVGVHDSVCRQLGHEAARRSRLGRGRMASHSASAWHEAGRRCGPVGFERRRVDVSRRGHRVRKPGALRRES
jgi:hypothetical protein